MKLTRKQGQELLVEQQHLQQMIGCSCQTSLAISLDLETGAMVVIHAPYCALQRRVRNPRWN